MRLMVAAGNGVVRADIRPALAGLGRRGGRAGSGSRVPARCAPPGNRKSLKERVAIALVKTKVGRAADLDLTDDARDPRQECGGRIADQRATAGRDGPAPAANNREEVHAP